MINYTAKIVRYAQGGDLLARGRVLKTGTFLTLAAADVYSVVGDEETLCALAFVTMRNTLKTSPFGES